eukprot:230529-Prymnesium_polylepis.1
MTARYAGSRQGAGGSAGRAERSAQTRRASKEAEMAGKGREDAGEVPAAAGCPAAQTAPGERMRGCGPVPSPQ